MPMGVRVLKAIRVGYLKIKSSAHTGIHTHAHTHTYIQRVYIHWKSSPRSWRAALYTQFDLLNELT